MIRAIKYTQNDSPEIRKSGSWMEAEPVYCRLDRGEIAARLRQAIEVGEQEFYSRGLLRFSSRRGLRGVDPADFAIR